MLRHFVLIVLFASITDWSTSYGGQEKSLEIVVEGRSFELSLSAMKQIEGLQEAIHTVKSPIYNKKKSYRGFDLLDLLKKSGYVKRPIKTLKFLCRDNYAPEIDLSLHALKLFIAFEEADKLGYFEPISEGKVVLNPQPFFVMTYRSEDFETFAWPHQVMRVEVNPDEGKYLISANLSHKRHGKLSSEEKIAIEKGEKAFSQHCLACHSINLHGGQIGPELNIPKNITEYRDRDFLKQFIVNPRSFRARSRMLPMPHLKAEELIHILSYLEHMKDEKVLTRLKD